MYIQFHHAQIGARMLREMGVEDGISELVAATAEPEKQGDPLDLRIIQAADGDRVVGKET
jgi:hypothetical protein